MSELGGLLYHCDSCGEVFTRTLAPVECPKCGEEKRITYAVGCVPAPEGE